jgi:hypothetical protein
MKFNNSRYHYRRHLIGQNEWRLRTVMRANPKKGIIILPVAIIVASLFGGVAISNLYGVIVIIPLFQPIRFHPEVKKKLDQPLEFLVKFPTYPEPSIDPSTDFPTSIPPIKSTSYAYERTKASPITHPRIRRPTHTPAVVRVETTEDDEYDSTEVEEQAAKDEWIKSSWKDWGVDPSLVPAPISMSHNGAANHQGQFQLSHPAHLQGSTFVVNSGYQQYTQSNYAHPPSKAMQLHLAQLEVNNLLAAITAQSHYTPTHQEITHQFYVEYYAWRSRYDRHVNDLLRTHGLPPNNFGIHSSTSIPSSHAPAPVAGHR